MIPALVDHLVQSTLCVGGALVLTRLLKAHAAAWRYRVWLAASLKFAVPFALLAAVGTALQPPRFVLPSPPMDTAVALVAIDVTPEAAPVERSGRLIVAGLATIWLTGGLALVITRAVGRRRLATLRREATPIAGGREQQAFERALSRAPRRLTVELRASPVPVEPGVVGIRRPAILWPSALLGRLGDRELEAIFTHELAHVRRRDNFTAAVHGWLEVVFWFHPLIWWLKGRLVAERERACDEAVLRAGSEPQSYVRGILKVCEFCLQSPVAPAAAVTGADLMRRVEDIMTARTVPTLSFARRTLLAAAAVAVILGPLAAGSVHATSISMPMVGRPAVRLSGATVSAPPAAAPRVLLAATQAQGTISGVVTDQRGAPIRDAEVVATPDGGAALAPAQTDVNGLYTITAPPAQYGIRVQKPGFTAAANTVFVNRGAQVRFDAQLRVGSVAESIRVIPSSAAAELQAASETLDRAKASLEQGQLAEAENLLTRVTNAIRMSRVATALQNREAAVARAAAGGGPVRVGGEISAPRKIHDQPPVYPQVARDAKVSGIVILDAIVGTDGTVKEAKILRGQPLLNQAALDAVTNWVYTPTLLNGAPVEVQMSVTVSFTLQ